LRRRFRSHRFRRRALWIGSVTCVALAAVGGAIVIGNTGTPAPERLSNRPAVVYHEPKSVPLSRTARAHLLSESLRFVASAVTRHDVDAAYDLTSRHLRQGLTRTQWHSGNIPVIPFPAVSLAAWGVDWSYSDDVALDLALRADNRSDIVGKTFTIELKRYGKRWLVENWTPNGISGPGNVKSLKRQAEAATPPAARLGAEWLLVPVAIFSLLLLLPLGFAARSWRDGRRAMRAYEAERTG